MVHLPDLVGQTAQQALRVCTLQHSSVSSSSTDHQDFGRLLRGYVQCSSSSSSSTEQCSNKMHTFSSRNRNTLSLGQQKVVAHCARRRHQEGKVLASQYKRTLLN